MALKQSVKYMFVVYQYPCSILQEKNRSNNQCYYFNCVQLEKHVFSTLSLFFSLLLYNHPCEVISSLLPVVMISHKTRAFLCEDHYLVQLTVLNLSPSEYKFFRTN